MAIRLPDGWDSPGGLNGAGNNATDAPQSPRCAGDAIHLWRLPLSVSSCEPQACSTGIHGGGSATVRASRIEIREIRGRGVLQGFPATTRQQSAGFIAAQYPPNHRYATAFACCTVRKTGSALHRLSRQHQPIGFVPFLVITSGGDFQWARRI